MVGLAFGVRKILHRLEHNPFVRKLFFTKIHQQIHRQIYGFVADFDVSGRKDKGLFDGIFRIAHHIAEGVVPLVVLP